MASITVNPKELEHRWGRRSAAPPPSLKPPDYDAIARELGGTPASNEDPDKVAKELGGVSDEERRTFLGFLANVPKSTGELFGSFLDVPGQTKGLTNLFADMSAKSGFKPLPGVEPGAVDAVIDHYKQRYGSWEGVKKAMYEDPAGVAFDVSMLLEGGGMLPGRLGTTATRVGRAVNPVTQGVRVIGRTAEALPYVPRAIGAAAEGLGTSLRKSSLRGGYAVNTPREKVAAATEAMRGVPFSEEGLAQNRAAERAIQEQKMKLLAEAELRGAGTPRDLLVQELEKIRRQYQERAPLPGQDVQNVERAIQEVLETYPEQIPATKAEMIKEGTKYKEGVPPHLRAVVASEQGIQDVIRRNLSEWVPELEELNRTQQGKILLDDFMDKALNKRSNTGGFLKRMADWRNVMTASGVSLGAGASGAGLSSAIIGLGSAFTGALISDPVIQANLAQLINRAQQSNPARWGAPSVKASVARAAKVAQDARIPIERRLNAPTQEVRQMPGAPDTSFVQPVQGVYPTGPNPRRALPPPETRITPTPADTSGIRIIDAQQGIAFDPKTGQTFRYYSSGPR